MNIIQKVIEQAVSNLASAGAKYTITTADGTQYTNEEKTPERVALKRNRLLPVGTYYKVFHPILSQMNPGDFRQVDVPEDAPDLFHIENLRGAMCAWASENWGKGSYSTDINQGKVDIFRN